LSEENPTSYQYIMEIPTKLAWGKMSLHGKQKIHLSPFFFFSLYKKILFRYWNGPTIGKPATLSMLKRSDKLFRIRSFSQVPHSLMASPTHDKEERIKSWKYLTKHERKGFSVEESRSVCPLPRPSQTYLLSHEKLGGSAAGVFPLPLEISIDYEQTHLERKEKQ